MLKHFNITGRVVGRGNLRILYLAGPGDATAVLRTIAEGRSDDGIAHVAYSRQVFEVCKALDATLLCVSTNPRLDDFSHGKLRSINRVDPFKGKARLGYHFANVTYAREIDQYAREINANVVITATEPHPVFLEPLSLRGVHVVPALHALLWPEFRKPSRVLALMIRLSRHFFSSSCSAILSHPGLAVEQTKKLTHNKHQPIVEFLPLYPHGMFANAAQPQADAEVFRVLTVGRVEENKGIFDLIEIAKRVRERSKSPVRFDVCGTGGAIEEARRRIQDQGLSDLLVLHGWTSMEDLEALWGQSHLCVVPTTSQFVEGFNQVVVEAALAGRPVITSSVCPSLDFVRPCAIEVPVDDVEAYVRAIVSLADDRARYTELQSRCAAVVRPFFDETKSFRAAVRHVLEGLMDRGAVTPVSVRD